MIEIIIIDNCINSLIQIYDKNNRKIIDKYINNKITFNGKINNTYKIVVATNKFIFKSSFIMRKNIIYIFDLKNKYHKIHIKYKDQNYKDLQIEKGEIKLWQNHIL